MVHHLHFHQKKIPDQALLLFFEKKGGCLMRKILEILRPVLVIAGPFPTRLCYCMLRDTNPIGSVMTQGWKKKHSTLTKTPSMYHIEEYNPCKM